jgi:hypothetical protein
MFDIREMARGRYNARHRAAGVIVKRRRIGDKRGDGDRRV